MARYALFVDFSSTQLNGVPEDQLPEATWKTLRDAMEQLGADIHLYSIKEKKPKGRPGKIKTLVIATMAELTLEARESGEEEGFTHAQTMDYFTGQLENPVKASSLKRVLRELVTEGYLLKEFTPKDGNIFSVTDRGFELARTGVESWQLTDEEIAEVVAEL